MIGSLTGCGSTAPAPSQVTLPDHFNASLGGGEALFMSAIQQNGQWLQSVTRPGEDHCWKVIESEVPEATPPPNLSSASQSSTTTLKQCHVPDCETTECKKWYKTGNARLCNACYEVYRGTVQNKAKKILGVKQISFRDAKAELVHDPEKWNKIMDCFYKKRATVLRRKQTQSKGGQEVCHECNKTFPSLRKGPDETRICQACYMIFLRAVQKAYKLIPKQANNMPETKERFSISAAKKVLKEQQKWQGVLDDYRKTAKEIRWQEKPSGEVIESGRPEPTPPPNSSSNSRGVKRKRGRKPIDRSNFQCHVPACPRTQSKRWYKGPDKKRICSACNDVYKRTILNEAKKVLGVNKISFPDAKAALETKPEKLDAAIKLFYDRRATVLGRKQTQSKRGQEETKVCQKCNATESSKWRNGPDETRICGACYMSFYGAVNEAYKLIPKQGNDMLKTGEKFSIAAAQEVLKKQGQWTAVLDDYNKRVQEKKR
jgi:hypothetical protein